ncbi:MAG TPA: glycosyltransferase, partial [Pirellulales bacterium]
CLPTFYEAETFGVVLVEAMSFQLPVVATRWRGIPEIVDDGVTGFLIEAKKASAVADRLQQLQLNPDLRLAMGEAGRAKFLREFTAELYWQRMEDVFYTTAKTSNC